MFFKSKHQNIVKSPVLNCYFVEIGVKECYKGKSLNGL